MSWPHLQNKQMHERVVSCFIPFTPITFHYALLLQNGRNKFIAQGNFMMTNEISVANTAV